MMALGREAMLCVLACGAAAVGAGFAQHGPVAQASLPASTRAVPLTRADLEAFADSFFLAYLDGYPEPSLAVIVVSREGVVFQKGYGWRDRVGGAPVDPDATLFHVASISKLVTATAALQLAEQGRMKLRADVNDFLRDFQIEGEGPRVTPWHLLTHTSGLDGPFMRGVVADAADLVPLGEYFRRYPPARGRAPGREIRYSNDGMALAGHLVEIASGRAFHDYVEHHIFAPLQMHRSSFRQPPPAALQGAVATAGAGPVPDALQTYPSGAMVSTAADMGRFMRAHLRQGELDGARILQPATARAMQATQWRADPRQPGVALGFFESDIGGEMGLFHTGARVHFSLLYLLPAPGLGLFLVHALRQGGEFQGLRAEFVRAFVERYLSRDPTAGMAAVIGSDEPEHSRPASDPNELTGAYRPILVSAGTIERAAWLGMDTPVRRSADGTLLIKLPGTAAMSLQPLAKDLYRVSSEAAQAMTLSFQRARDGQVRGLSLSGGTQDPVSFERLAWYQRGRLHAALLAAAFLPFFSCALGSVATGVRRVFRGRREITEPAGPRLPWICARAASILAVLSPLSILVLVMTHRGDDTAAHGLRSALTAGMSLLIPAAVLALSLLPFAWRAWRRRYWSLLARWYFTMLAGAAGVAVPLLWHYHLLGFRF